MNIHGLKLKYERIKNMKTNLQSVRSWGRQELKIEECELAQKRIKREIKDRKLKKPKRKK